jgi:hypothetical protein
MELEPIHTQHHAANLPPQQHAMLLYSNGDSRASAQCVSDALCKGQLTVYAPVISDNNINTSHISALPSEIVNHLDNVNQDNLLTLNGRSFYNLALAGNREPFEELKILIEEAIQERIASGKSDEVTLVMGIAGMLAMNLEFDQCIDLEKWWQKTHSEWVQKGLKITLICLHPNQIFDKSNQFMHYKQAMPSLHQIVVNPV